MNNFNELIKKFQELGLAQNNTKVDLPETPKNNTICRLYNNHFGLYNNTHMRECNHIYTNKEAVLLQIPYYMITGSAVLNRSKFDSFLSGGCMPYGWTKSTIEGLNYKSVNSFLFDKRLFGVYGVHNNQPAYFVFSDTIRDLVGENLQEVLYEITGVNDAYRCIYPCNDEYCCGCSQCYTSLGESKIDTKQFENKSVFEIAELFGKGCQVFVDLKENKLEIFNENNKYSFIVEYLDRHKHKPLKRVYNYFPSDKRELEAIIEDRIKKEGNNCDLNDIDVSKITDMSFIFAYTKFNGDISKWDVSNVRDMSNMFESSKFNGDISKWDVSNVRDMSYMFYISDFNGDISDWDVSKVEDMSNMFKKSPLEKNPPKWYKK